MPSDHFRLALAHALDQRRPQQIGPMPRRIGCDRAQRRVALGARGRILLLEPLLVGDGLLLDIFDIQRPAKPVVEIKNIRRHLAADDTAKQRGQLDAVMDSEIQAEPAERVVDVSGIAGEEGAALAERRGDALMHVVDIAMDDGIRAGLRKEPLQPRLHGRLVEGFVLAFHQPGGEHDAPKALAVVAGDLEQRGPLVRIREVVAGAFGKFGTERIGRREHQEPFRMGVALELDVEALAHRRAAAVRADQIGGWYLARSGRRLDLDLDPIVELLETTDARRELDLDVRQHLQPTEGYIGELVLLALHDIRKARVMLQYSEIELGNDGAAGTIPDAELGFDQTPPGHLFHQSEIFQNLEGGSVGGGGARAVIDTSLGFEKPNLQSLPGERERRHHADRAATRNDDG